MALTEQPSNLQFNFKILIIIFKSPNQLQKIDSNSSD